MSYNLFEESKYNFLKKYLSAILILFLTFVIPVSVNEIYRKNTSLNSAAQELKTTSLAQNTTPSGNVSFPDFVTYVTNYLSSNMYTILIIGGIVFLVLWIILIMWYMRVRRSD